MLRPCLPTNRYPLSCRVLCFPWLLLLLPAQLILRDEGYPPAHAPACVLQRIILFLFDPFFFRGVPPRNTQLREFVTFRRYSTTIVDGFDNTIDFRMHPSPWSRFSLWYSCFPLDRLPSIIACTYRSVLQFIPPPGLSGSKNRGNCSARGEGQSTFLPLSSGCQDTKKKTL